MKKEMIFIFGLLIFLVLGIVYTHAQALDEEYKNNPKKYISSSDSSTYTAFVQWFSTRGEPIMAETWARINNNELRKKLVNSLNVKTQVKLYKAQQVYFDPVKQKYAGITEYAGITDDVIKAINPESLNSFIENLIISKSKDPNRKIKVQGLERLKSGEISTGIMGDLIKIKDSYSIHLSVPESIDLISLMDKGIQYENSKNSNVLFLSKGYILKELDISDVPTGRIKVIDYATEERDIDYATEERENPIINLNNGKGQAIMIGIPAEGYKNGIHMWGDAISVDIGDYTFKPNPYGLKDEEARPWGFVNENQRGVFNLRGDVSAPGLGLVIYNTDKGIFDTTGVFPPDPVYSDVIFRYKSGSKEGEKILSFSGNIEGHASFRTFDDVKFEYKDINGNPVLGATRKHVDNLGERYSTFYELVKEGSGEDSRVETYIPWNSGDSGEYTNKGETPQVKQNPPQEDLESHTSSSAHDTVGEVKPPCSGPECSLNTANPGFTGSTSSSGCTSCNSVYRRRGR